MQMPALRNMHHPQDQPEVALITFDSIKYVICHMLFATSKVIKDKESRPSHEAFQVILITF